MMQSVEPQLGTREITLAVNQSEYEPLVIAIFHNTELGCTAAVSRWKPSEEEREKIANGEDIFLAVMVAGAFPPVMLQAGNEGLDAKKWTYANYVPLPPEK